jgi:hypothetical protein
MELTIEQRQLVDELVKIGSKNRVLTKEDVFYTCNEDEDLSYFIQDYFFFKQEFIIIRFFNLFFLIFYFNFLALFLGS